MNCRHMILGVNLYLHPVFTNNSEDCHAKGSLREIECGHIYFYLLSLCHLSLQLPSRSLGLPGLAERCMEFSCLNVLGVSHP